MHLNAIADGLLPDIVNVVGEGDDPFRERETDGECRQIFRGGHHHHMRNAVIHQRHAH